MMAVISAPESNWATDMRTPSSSTESMPTTTIRSVAPGTDLGTNRRVLVDLDALEENPGGLHETETGTVLTVTAIRQLGCDSSVSRMVWNAESEIIDIGRKTRIIPAATRRTLIARDRHCVIPGCGRGPRWCEAHHIVHWADGGATDLDNLCLLCRYHHTQVHQDETMTLVLIDQLQSVGARRPT